MNPFQTAASAIFSTQCSMLLLSLRCAVLAGVASKALEDQMADTVIEAGTMLGVWDREPAVR